MTSDSGNCGDNVAAGNPNRKWGWSSLSGPASIVISVGALIYAVILLRALPARANGLDFSHYYASALMMRTGLNPYTDDIKPLASSLGLEVGAITLSTYPPTFLLLLEPLTLLFPPAAYGLWTALSLVCLAITLYLLLDDLPKDYRLRLSLVGLVILYPPITNNLVWGQAQIMLLLTFTLFMRWLGSGRNALAGAIIGFAGLLKVFPLLMVGYLLIRSHWKTIFYAVLVVAVGGLITLSIVGIGRSLDSIGPMASVTSQRWLGRQHNVALAAIVSHIFWYSAAPEMGSFAGLGVHLSPGMELTRRVTVLMAELAVLALTVYATFRSSRLPEGRDDHVIALWVATTILVSPTAWVHYLVMLLIPYGVLLRRYLRGESPRLATWLGLASFAIGELLMILDLIPVTPGSPIHRTLQDFGFWATLIGWPVSLLLAYAATYSLAIETVPPPIVVSPSLTETGQTVPI